LQTPAHGIGSSLQGFGKAFLAKPAKFNAFLYGLMDQWEHAIT
jgi:hypothetical protein